MSTIHERYKNVTSLTPNAIKNILEPERLYFIVQIYEKSHANYRNNVRVKISDGHAMYTVLLADEAFKKAIRFDLKEQAIIRIDSRRTLVSSQQETASTYKPVLITDFELIYANVGKMIGKPLPFSEFQKNAFVNEEGSTQVPREFLELFPESTQSQARQEHREEPKANRVFPKQPSFNNLPLPLSKSNSQSQNEFFSAVSQKSDADSQSNRKLSPLIAKLKGNNERSKSKDTAGPANENSNSSNTQDFISAFQKTITPRQLLFEQGDTRTSQDILITLNKNKAPREMSFGDVKNNANESDNSVTEKNKVFDISKYLPQEKDMSETKPIFDNWRFSSIKKNREHGNEEPTSPTGLITVREFLQREEEKEKSFKNTNQTPERNQGKDLLRRDFNFLTKSSRKSDKKTNVQGPSRPSVFLNTTSGSRAPLIVPSEDRIAFCSSEDFTPVKALISFMESWIIKVRVTLKSDVREYKSRNGQPGKVFSLDLLDAEGGEIQISFFDQLCNKFHNNILEGGLYSISGGKIKSADQNLTGLRHDYNIIADNSTTLKLLPDDRSIAPNVFQFVHLSEIRRIEKGRFIDTVGFVSNPGYVQTIDARGRSTLLKKRTVLLTADHHETFELVIWGPKAETLFLQRDDVAILKRVKVAEFNGQKQLNLVHTSSVITKDIHRFPEAQRMLLSTRKEQFMNESLDLHKDEFSIAQLSSPRSNGVFSSLKTLEQIEHVANNEIKYGHKQSFETIVSISDFVKDESLYYPACNRCRKKLVQDRMMWRCKDPMCNFETETPHFVFNLQVHLDDASSNIWAVAFDTVGEKIMGIKAKDFRDFLISRQYRRLDTIRANVQSKEYKIRLTASLESYGRLVQARYQITHAELVNFRSESSHVLNLLSAYDSI